MSSCLILSGSSANNAANFNTYVFFLGNATHIDLDIIVDSIGEINSLRKVVCLNNGHFLNILDETIVRNQDFISK